MLPPAVPGEPDYIITEEDLLARDWSRGQAPFFRVDEVAKVFFGMSASWVRLRCTADADHPDSWFTHPDGSPIEFRRLDPDNDLSARVFTLADIEPMARSLLKYGKISPYRLVRILEVVRAIAQLYGLFDAPAASQGDAGDEVPTEDEAADD